MHFSFEPPLRAVATAICIGTIACSRTADLAEARAKEGDSAFRAMQERGKMAMGVDQGTSTHRFDALPDGGRIQLMRDVEDSVGINQIRAHLRLIQHAFQAGDFSTPQFVHMQTMPGTKDMARLRKAISYSYRDIPRGGEVDMHTSDSTALAAIHAFMGAQRTGHRAGGMPPTQ